MRFYATKPEFFPYTTLFRSGPRGTDGSMGGSREGRGSGVDAAVRRDGAPDPQLIPGRSPPHPRLSALPARADPLLLPPDGVGLLAPGELKVAGDRKSTRLNSSHVATSYALFCLQNISKTS